MGLAVQVRGLLQAWAALVLRVCEKLIAGYHTPPRRLNAVTKQTSPPGLPVRERPATPFRERPTRPHAPPNTKAPGPVPPPPNVKAPGPASHSIAPGQLSRPFPARKCGFA